MPSDREVVAQALSHTRLVRIDERPSGWAITFPLGAPVVVPTAAEALRRVRSPDFVGLTIIEWSPVSAIGRRVVRALQ